MEAGRTLVSKQLAFDEPHVHACAHAWPIAARYRLLALLEVTLKLFEWWIQKRIFFV